MAHAEPLVRVTRSGLEESIHAGHVAVCDVEGRLIASAGDPRQPVFARSSMKPFQAAVALVAIGSPGPSRTQAAVMCASHNGEAIHVRTVRGLLASARLGFEALRCPPMLPMDEEAAIRARRPAPQFGDCSGKHAGMLAACVGGGWDTDTYLKASHPLQRRIRRAVALATGADLVTGVDGCGVPTFGLPLSAMATLFARLSLPEGLGDLAPQAQRCQEAMRAEPYLVAGRDRTDTAVMTVAPGIVVKSGAEALACAGIVGEGVGVAVRIADGGARASGPALIRALALLGALSDAQVESLARFARRPVTGGGRRVGDVIADFNLRGGRRASRPGTTS